jgi:AraC-like DNA-binding protein
MSPLSNTQPAAVAATAAKNYAIPAELGTVDLRADERVTAGSYVQEGPALTTGWHSHEFHQLEYSWTGALGLETELGRFVVLPQQVAWIPARVRHISTLGAARTVSVFLSPHLVQDAPVRPAAFPANPLLREMILHAARWPITRTKSDNLADGFYDTLGMLLPEWLEDRQSAALPVSADPLISQAIRYTHERLATITHAQLSRAVGMSERTLRRKFASATGMTWSDYVRLARLLQALGRLASTTATVTQVAAAVGFDSPAAFTRAFVLRVGETPSAYRRRVTATAQHPNPDGFFESSETPKPAATSRRPG